MLKATGISKIFKTKRGEVTALAPCSLEFGESGLVLVCGESGGGKTTLLNILAGTDSPSSGTVECSFGKYYGSFVFQGGRLSDSLTVEENFQLVKRMFPEKCKDFREDAERFGLTPLLNRKPSELSFGEVQRAAIIRTAMAGRPVLFADEPTANLDEENCRMVAELLKEISRERLVIVSTHEREYFDDIADRIIFLKRGKIISDSSKAGGEAPSAEENAAAEPLPEGGTDGEVNGGADSGINICAPVLGAKTAFWLAGKTLRRTAVAVALTVVFLAVCVFSLTTFSNLYFSDDITSTIAAVRNDGSAVFELKKDHISYGTYGLNMIINGGDTSPVTDEELEQFKEDYGAVFFCDGNFDLSVPDATINGIPVSRIYVSDSCFLPVQYGSADLNGGIAISSVSAERVRSAYGVDDIGDMIGLQAGGFTISCIYSVESAAYDSKALPYEDVEGLEGRVVMSEEAFLQRIADACGRVCTLRKSITGTDIEGEFRFGAFSRVKDEPMYFTPVYGEDGPAAGEIYVSERYASQNGGAEAILGTEQTFLFAGPDGKFAPNTFTVSGIFDTAYTEYFILSDGDALDLALKYGEWRMNGNTGICLPEYSEGDVRELKAAGFSENSYLTENIAEALDWFDSLNSVLAVVCGISGICALAALIFYAAFAFARCGREVGILRSFGLSSVRASLVFFCQLCVAVAAALVIGAAVGIASVSAWNSAAFAAAGAMTVYFVPLCLLVSLGTAAVAFGFGALFVYLCAVAKSSARFLRES